MPSHPAYRRYVSLLAVVPLFGAVSPLALGSSASAREEPLVRKAPAVPKVLDPAAARLVADKQITQAQLRDYLTFIASDEMEGRDTPSRGLDTTAKFIAFNLARWGAKPMGGDGTFFQKIALVRRRLDEAKTTAALNDAPLKYGDDFLAAGQRGSAEGTASGPLVYVGPGWVIKSKNIDPYAGVDIKGKVIVVSGVILPTGVTPGDVPQARRGADWFSPADYAARNGAVGIVYLPRTGTTTTAEWDAARNSPRFRGGGQGGWEMEATAAATAPPPPAVPARALPVINVSPDAAARLFAGENVTAGAAMRGEGTPFALKAEKKIAFTVAFATERTATQNVVGVIEGSDPRLKSEYVAFGAHYDHIGIGRPDAKGDTINNGADDDGSGTSALLAMAEAAARSPLKPRRSLLFVWHCGEEKGLWGSDYFTRNPTVPLKQIAAQVNIDMIGRSKPAGDTQPRNASLSGPTEVYTIGPRIMSEEMARIVEMTNKGYLNLNLNSAYDDEKERNRFFFRSDHYNYAKKGIPIIFFFDGVHVDYHRPSDEVSQIDFAKLERVTRTAFLVGVQLANRPNRVKVDRVP